MSKIEHKIKLVDKEPKFSKPYPLPYALRRELKNHNNIGHGDHLEVVIAVCVIGNYCREEVQTLFALITES